MDANANHVLFEPFAPRGLLRNGHAQTLAGNFLPRQNLLPPAEERLFQVTADTQVLCHCHWQPDRRSRPAIVIVHGLEGSSDSQYVVGVGSKAWCAGMNVVRMNMRNCGGTEKLTPTLYHSGLSSDVGAVVRSLIDEEKLQRVGIAGYSMGGNLVLKLAGEWGNSAPPEFRVAVAVSPAADLAASAEALHLLSNRIYEWKFLTGLMRRYRRKQSLFPAIYQEVVRFPRSIVEFDDVITARYNGFTGAQDYYSRAAAAKVVDAIAAPTLVLHAEDDPFVRLLPETRAKILANPHVTLLETQHGGHCAFLAQPNGYDGRWAERQIVEFFLRQGMD
ncbi:MAG TPA: alpha/beta fold hydrolase [Candidatus Angelobacter sp.]|nr:alpha/beta fold hydrolase [Candidatus Angelobacter sp.]